MMWPPARSTRPGARKGGSREVDAEVRLRPHGHGTWGMALGAWHSGHGSWGMRPMRVWRPWPRCIADRSRLARRKFDQIAGQDRRRSR